jgi:hypothetical protein
MSFEETAALDDVALRARVTGADPVERVWAIWALALRSGATAVAGRLAGEPDPGVRRHLAVVLAGGGEVDLLVAMSRHDPDAGVRGVATGLVARLALGGALPWEIAVERLDDPSPVVRVAVLAEIPARADATRMAVATRAMRDPDPDVRLEALDVVLRSDLTAAASAACDRLDAAGVEEAIGILIRWSDRAGAAAVHAGLRGQSRRVRRHAIYMLSRAWDDVAAIALDPDPAVQSAVREQFANRLGRVPVAVIARWVTGDIGYPPNFQDAALDEIASRAASGERPPADRLIDLRAICERRRDAAAAILRAAGIDPAVDWSEVDLDSWDDGDSDLYGELAEHQRMTEILDKLAG